MIFAVPSVFDVALWFLDRARIEDKFLPPQKLHRLLFLAQASFAVEQEGAKLMPAVFVAGHDGPVEPNILRIFEHGRPKIMTEAMTEEVVEFLCGIWWRFAHLNMDHLNQRVSGISGFDQVVAAGEGSEIPMGTLYRTMKGKSPTRLGHTQDGKQIQRWIPGVKSARG